MENMISTELCVICLGNNGFDCIFQSDSNMSISQKILECTGFEIPRDPNLPNKICRNCSTYMNIAYKFRVLVKASFKTLTEHLENFKQEEQILADYIYEDSQYEPCNESVQDFQLINNNQYQDGNGELDSIKQEENSTNSNNINSPTKTKLAKKSPKRISRNKKHAKEKIKVFICELCGNQYKHKYLLEKHVQWHNNVRLYTCEICSKSFSDGSNLKKHMMIHTGEKPYACSYCNQKFTLNKTKIRHERIHTGERPHVCLTCDKTFAYDHVLTNHILTHTGEKPFQCVPCNKNFAKKHQLKNHTETLTHKAQVGASTMELGILEEDEALITGI